MTIALGKVGKGSITGANSGTVTWTGGGNSTAGSTLLLLYTSNSTSNDTPTTPTNWTLRASAVNSSGNMYLYEWVNANAIASQALNLIASPDAATLDMVEFTGAGFLDSSTAVATASSGTTLTTNGITTIAANTVMVAFFSARHAVGGPRTLNTPGAGFTQAQTDNEVTGGIGAETSYVTYDVVSATQSNKTTTCTSSATTAWNALILAYATSFDPSVDNAFTERLTQTPLRSWAMNRQTMSVVQMAQHSADPTGFPAWQQFDNPVKYAGAIYQEPFPRPSNILWSPRRLAAVDNLREFPESQDVPGVNQAWNPADQPAPWPKRRITPPQATEIHLTLPVVAADVGALRGWANDSPSALPKRVRLQVTDVSFSVLLAPDTSGTFLLDQNPFHRVRYVPRLLQNDLWVTAFQQVTVPGPDVIVAISVQSPSPLPMARQRIGSQHSEPVSIAAPGFEYITGLLTQGERPRPVLSSFPRREAGAVIPDLVQPAGIALDWNVDQQTPIRRVPRAVPHAEDQSQWFATLTADVVHAWDVPTSQPFRRLGAPSRAQGEDARITLIVSAAESFAWAVENPSPIRQPYRPRDMFDASLFFDATGGGAGPGFIIVLGPYYTVSGDFWISGAVQGDILGEG